MRRGKGRGTYDKDRDDDVPGCVYHVHLPSDVIETDGHYKYEYESDINSLLVS